MFPHTYILIPNKSFYHSMICTVPSAYLEFINKCIISRNLEISYKKWSIFLSELTGMTCDQSEGLLQLTSGNSSSMTFKWPCSQAVKYSCLWLIERNKYSGQWKKLKMKMIINHISCKVCSKTSEMLGFMIFQ